MYIFFNKHLFNYLKKIINNLNAFEILVEFSDDKNPEINTKVGI